MITDLILTVILAPLSWLLSVIPTFTWPDWMDPAEAFDAGSGIGSTLTAFSAWVPVGTLLTVGAGIGSLWAGGFAVKGVRMVISTVTGGGGAT